MICPTCESKNVRCLDTRTFYEPNEDFYWTERRRRCQSCAEIYKTIEVPLDVWQSRQGDSNG